jgi:hypothetical protein
MISGHLSSYSFTQPLVDVSSLTGEKFANLL